MQTGRKQNPNIMETLQVYLIFAVSGGTALVYQIIWARWLILLFGNTTTSVSIVLSSFMLGLALGSWVAGRFLHKVDNPVRLYALAEFGIGLFALFFPLLSRLTDIIFGSFVTAESPLSYSLFIRANLAFILLLLPTTLMGTTLPLLTDFFTGPPDIP